MSFVIDLAYEEGTQVQEHARRQGLNVADSSRRLIHVALPAKPKIDGEMLAYGRKIGLCANRADIHDSADYARDLRRKAETHSRL